MIHVLKTSNTGYTFEIGIHGTGSWVSIFSNNLIRRYVYIHVIILCENENGLLPKLQIFLFYFPSVYMKFYVRIFF